MKLTVEIKRKDYGNEARPQAEVRIGNQSFIFAANDDNELNTKIKEYAAFHGDPTKPGSLKLKEVGGKKDMEYDTISGTLV